MKSQSDRKVWHLVLAYCLAVSFSFAATATVAVVNWQEHTGRNPGHPNSGVAFLVITLLQLVAPVFVLMVWKTRSAMFVISYALAVSVDVAWNAYWSWLSSSSTAMWHPSMKATIIFAIASIARLAPAPYLFVSCSMKENNVPSEGEMQMNDYNRDQLRQLRWMRAYLGVACLLLLLLTISVLILPCRVHRCCDPRESSQYVMDKRALMESGRYGDVLDLAQKRIEERDDDAQAYFDAGMACWRLKRYEDAISYLEKAEELIPQWKEYTAPVLSAARAKTSGKDLQED